MAYHLTRKWSKERILTEYLNTVYFGNGAYGIEAAARTYFGADPNHEGCGTPKRDVRQGAHAGRGRAARGDHRVAERLRPRRPPGRRQAPARRRAQEDARPGAHHAAQYHDALAAADRTTSSRRRGSTPGRAPSTSSPGSARASSTRSARRRRSRATCACAPRSTSSCSRPPSRPSTTTCPGPAARPRRWSCIDNKTAQVRAMVGGRDYQKSPFNLATQGQRQPGSSIKPFILAEALRQGIAPGAVYPSRKRYFRVPRAAASSSWSTTSRTSTPASRRSPTR